MKLATTIRNKLITARNIGFKKSCYIILTRYLHMSISINFIKRIVYSEKYNHLLKILENKNFILYPPFMSWDIPMFQRPQHLAIKLAEKGFLFIYCTNNVYDRNLGVVEIQPNLFIVDSYFYKNLIKLQQKKVIILHPNHHNLYNKKRLDKLLLKDNRVIYDYLDDLGEEVFGKITEYHKALHKSILNDERIICLASADVLYKQAQNYRTKNLYLVPNATDPNHFTKVKNAEITHYFDFNKKTIGYFGALAKWVDFELIIKIAQHYPEMQIVLIGQKYDSALDRYKFNQYKNIIFPGPINYKILPNYAKYFDVSIIPFLINETTVATSPIKLFEYMSLGKPIVTTDLPECRKYQSALIAKTHDEFIDLLNRALTISRDDPYFNILKQEAKNNSWDARADEIIKAINNR